MHRVKSEKFVKVKGTKSPYDGDFIYWTIQLKNYSSLSIQVRTLLRKQNAICPLCKVPFTCLDKMEVDHIIPRSKGGGRFIQKQTTITSIVSY